MRARRTRSTKTGRSSSLFRGHRAGDTGELEPIRAEIPDEVPFAIRSDPVADRSPCATRPRARAVRLAEPAARPRRRRRRRSGWSARGAWSWSQDQYYVGEEDGTVVIYRGIDASLPGIDLSQPYESTNVDLDRLSDFDADRSARASTPTSLDDARNTVESLAAKMTPADARRAP